MRGGVCCHRGLSAASVSYSESLRRGVFENAHAEVRTTEAFGGAGRSDGDAVEKRHRSGRLDAIGAIKGRGNAGE